MPKKILILGGTSEAAGLARLGAARFGQKTEIISSLAGRRAPQPGLPGKVRIGGFGGVQGLSEYLKNECIDLVVDATHPFAAKISANAFAACIGAEVGRLALVRPPWRLPPNAKCLEVGDMEEAAKILPDISRRAFLTVGLGGSAAFSGVEGVWFLVRTIEPPAEQLPLKDFELICAGPPFTLEGELKILEDHKIDTLVSKHSGGEATHAKIEAALEKKIKIVLIRRPFPEPGEIVESAEEALEWLERRI
ncbi:MAG: cobalt-precorrin-6A reductase [Rhodospirillales bacterium]